MDMRLTILAVLLAASFAAGATNNNPPNECGNHGNNCQPAGDGGSNATATGGSGTGVGVGIGVGVGGQGGQGGGGGSGGDASAIGVGGDGGSVLGSGNSSNLNHNSANGGDAKAYGGNASQGQQQGQGQQQSSTSGAISGSKSIAQQALENSNRINASSANDNRSNASGNTTVTNVGGDSTLVERNAPPVFLGAITPTSCGGSIQAGASDRNGSGAFGVSWVGQECSKRMVADRFQQYGQVDVACRIMKTTKAFKAAVKDDPSLANIDCAMKPAPAPAPVLVAPELAPRIPRG